MSFCQFIQLLTAFKNKLPGKATALLHKKTHGGALYIAILVSIVIGIMLCLFILLARYNQRHLTLFTQSTQLYYNLQSAFQMAQSEYFTEENNGQWIKNTVNDDSVKVKKQQWGAYLMISALTKNRHRSLSQAGLYGVAMSADTGLVVADNGRPVSLSGEVVFRSNCYLPKAGIKPAFIEGQSYNGNPQNGSFVKTSSYQVAPVTENLVSRLEALQNNTGFITDSIVAALPQTFSQSFAGRTVVWQTASARLGSMHLKDNIKIVGNDIEIDSACHLQNVLIICNKIRFKENFKGRVHVIARDSIICEKNCGFSYPSSFVLLPAVSSSPDLLYIQFSADCKFTGGILALNREKGSQKVFIKLNARSEINGYLYSADYLHLEGTVNATAMCNKLLLKTASAVYENHMLACSIDAGKYARVLAVPLIFKQPAKLMCCENMN